MTKIKEKDDLIYHLPPKFGFNTVLLCKDQLLNLGRAIFYFIGMVLIS